jgi:uncharacterized membrane protein YvbJ
MFCNQCGVDTGNDAPFCVKCGGRSIETVSTPPTGLGNEITAQGPRIKITRSLRQLWR